MMWYLGCVQHLYDTRMSEGSQLLEGVLGKGEGRSVGRDIEREDAAVGAVLLQHKSVRQGSCMPLRGVYQ